MGRFTRTLLQLPRNKAALTSLSLNLFDHVARSLVTIEPPPRDNVKVLDAPSFTFLIVLHEEDTLSPSRAPLFTRIPIPG